MYLSPVFEIDSYKEFLITYFFLTYSCTYSPPQKKNVHHTDTIKPSAVISICLHWCDMLRNPINL